MNDYILVTGGAGFIGSALIRFLLRETSESVINVDKLTYAGNVLSLKEVAGSERYVFEQLDICDREAMEGVFKRYSPKGILHLAAESHVDRSIDGPYEFIKTNIEGTFILLEVARAYWSELQEKQKKKFRFHHVSTDEVFGSLGKNGLFTEDTAYQPNSPYSASKASSDHLVRAWHHTYGLPVVISNCSNNYGPYQYPEKLIPLMILKGLAGEPMPVYGKGNNVRDWLYVSDHARALYRIFQSGSVGETYNVGGNNEIKNIDVVNEICEVLDKLVPIDTGNSYKDNIEFVEDRPGHDMRYAIDSTKLQSELGWKPIETFHTGLRKSVEWYLDNKDWCEKVIEGRYKGERLGVAI